MLWSGCRMWGTASSCAPCWLTPGMQGMRVSGQEGFLVAVEAAVSPTARLVACSDIAEERKGVSSEGCHTPAHFIFTASQGDE